MRTCTKFSQLSVFSAHKTLHLLSAPKNYIGNGHLVTNLTYASSDFVNVSSQRLTAHLHTTKSLPYIINLDPAVHEVPFPANIGKKSS